MSSRWLVSRRDDLLWLHGSVLAGLALLAAFVALPTFAGDAYTLAHPALWLLLAWGVLFDGTHVLATYARSYLAPDAASRAALPGRAAWLWLIVGPAIAVVDALALPQGPSLLGEAGWLFRHFLLFAYLWAYWHLIRQHYGFLVLYRRRAGGSARLDAAALWVGGLYPYLRFSLSDAYARSGLPTPIPEAWLPALRVGLDVAALAALTLLAALFARRWRRAPPGPAEGLLAIVVAFHLLVFAFLEDLLAITAVLTIYHNLQYHRIVWQYERGLGRAPLGGLLRYLLVGAVFGLLWYGPRVLGVAALDSSLARNVLLGLGWGIALHHYHVDGKIWRVRRHTAVADALDRGARPAAAR